ncbi:MAG: NAD(P)/FAD-dependent oxidoreductase [Actinobacteria bacterium]|nr:NAD(P)/FAD-dependent oxidoreductase [Actinomycetota bacterium]
MSAQHHEHVDVLIVGAGLSGIGAACHLRRKCPGKTFAILESRDAIGGTWDLFRYPGVRSDSDMFTLGYSFKPWLEAKAIADGPSIRDYIIETASDHGVDEAIRFGHRVTRAEWSSRDARWTVTAARPETGETVQITCDFLFCCSGYYRYDEGYSPDFEGAEDFTGRIVHPQHWPEDLKYDGKRVVVIGSGATAVTLVPAMSEQAAHVTMLQRSPTYILSVPARDPIANVLRRILPEKAAYSAVRWKNVVIATALFQASRRAPRLMKRLLRSGVRRHLPSEYEVDRHFKPSYDPWDQRLCLVPDGDLFKSISAGRASIVTDRIERFTANGLRLVSGAELPADVVITATGLNVLLMGGMSVAIDGEDIDLSKTVAYKGMMLSGLPNFALTVGYTNLSWTLKADLVADYVCRLLNHMNASGYMVCTPRAPSSPDDVVPFLDLNAGYVLRALDDLPKQGRSGPWRLHQNYPRDVRVFKGGEIEDGAIDFLRGGGVAASGTADAAAPAVA